MEVLATLNHIPFNNWENTYLSASIVNFPKKTGDHSFLGSWGEVKILIYKVNTHADLNSMAIMSKYRETQLTVLGDKGEVST